MKQQQSLQLNKRARLYTLNQTSSKSNISWLVLHGYGMLAEYFINKFQFLADLGDHILAPEGLSRFYLEGYGGRVGASWMTKVDRENEIEDYLSYLDLAIDEFIPKENKLVLLGFSQGSATASRWFANTKKKIDGFIIHSARLAFELFENDKFLKRANMVKPVYIIGDKDPFSSIIKIAEEKERLKKAKIPFGLIEFKGGHDINQQSIIECRNRLTSSLI